LPRLSREAPVESYEVIVDVQVLHRSWGNIENDTPVVHVFLRNLDTIRQGIDHNVGSAGII
jgi:hypothetical protein